MRTFIYTLIAVMALSSCKSVDKLVKKGKYEEAFHYSLSFFKTSKKRKTEDVKALEWAYNALLEKDLSEIERLSLTFKPGNHGRIVKHYENISNRQSSLRFLLPLISEDGYEAKFVFDDYTELIREALNNAASFHYNEGINLISLAKTRKDKNLAKSAFREFEKAETYVYNFKSVDSLKNIALDLGHNFIVVEINNNLNGVSGRETENLLYNLALHSHNNEWYTFEFADEKNIGNADVIVELVLDDLIISPEKEDNHYFTEQKEILVKTDRWKEIKDSIEIEVIKEYHEMVKANIIETFREKNARLKAVIIITNNHNNVNIAEKPVHVDFNFSDRGMKFIGDERALMTETKNKMDARLDNFPMDSEIVQYLVSEFKYVTKSEINKLKS
jgi:hypothetical protein